jgi:hypothetical protein
MKIDEETRRRGDEEIDFLPVIDGELVEVSPVEINLADEEKTVVSAKNKITKTENIKTIPNPESQISNQKTYLLLPFVFLTVTLLGGLRLSMPESTFIFWRPALFCLISAAILMVLFFRAQLISLEGWFSEDFTTIKNVANGAVLVTLFAASAQIFNALLPEQGLPFWVFAFCFFWTLWNNLFADFDTKKLLKSLGALFGLAFVVKYLILANLTAPTSEGWLQGIFQNPTKEAFTWLLDLPRFSAGTGYIQFFTVVFYLFGLFLLPNNSQKK